MAEKGTKKHSFGIFFFVCFLAVVGISIIGNFKSRQYVEIDVPGGSIERLFTVEDKLAAIASGSKLLIWDWNDLTKPRFQKTFEAKSIILLANEQVVQVLNEKENTFIVTDLHSGVTQKTHSFGLEWKIDLMQTNRKGDFVVFVLNRSDLNNESSQKVKLELYNAAQGRIEPVTTILSNEDVEVYDAALSDKADLVAVSGKKGTGWIAVYGIASRKLIWEKEFANSPELEQVEFSADGKTVFAGWIDKKVVRFETQTSAVVESWDMEQSDKSQQQRKRLAALKISPDGRFLLAGKEVSGVVWVWDLEKGKSPAIFDSGNVHVSDIAISPACDKIVSTGFKATDKTRVWKLVK